MIATDTETDANQSGHNEDKSIPLDSDYDPSAFQPLSTTRSRPQGRNAAKKGQVRECHTRGFAWGNSKTK